VTVTLPSSSPPTLASTADRLAWANLLADLVVEGERVQCYPAQPSHKVDESNIGENAWLRGAHEVG
jgi:hypothetical protein